MKRLYNLDYLRGLAAFGIMIYHYLTWTFGDFTAEDFMGRIGIYGVSIFYCLSGLTLFSVYFENFNLTIIDIKSFFRKRILRIFPMLWIATILTILVTAQKFNYILLFLNLTGLFGFIKWNAYIATGAWSIGNELVFYVFFPVFVLFAKKQKIFFAILCLSIFLIYCYFAFFIFSPSESIVQQWRNYVNPLNQLFLFLTGFLLAYIFNKKNFTNITSLALIVSGLALFSFYPVEGDSINLIIGYNRLIFTHSCVVICLGFYKLSFQLPGFIHASLTILGESSYSVYLLHPIVYFLIMLKIQYLKELIGIPITFTLAIVLTLIVSYLVYIFIERPFIQFARKK